MALTKQQVVHVLKYLKRKHFSETLNKLSEAKISNENHKLSSSLAITDSLSTPPQRQEEIQFFKEWLDQEQKRFQEDENEIWPAMGNDQSAKGNESIRGDTSAEDVQNADRG